MAEYGVVPTGFALKRLPEILADLEEAMRAAFGPGVIQTAQSPLGNLNGVFSDLAREFWETALDTYQSFDVDQAEGPRLDILAKLRRMERSDGEGDLPFQLRITNQGQRDIRLTANIGRLAQLPGVTFAWAIENSTNVTNSFGMPAHSVAYAVLGGDDEEVAEQVYQLSVSGIGLVGNVNVDVVVDGFCRIVPFIRPALVRVRAEVDVKPIPSSTGCAPPNIGVLTQRLIEAFAGSNGFKNGEAVTKARVRSEAAQTADVDIVAVRIARVSNAVVADSLPMTLFEKAVIASPDVAVRYVP